MYPLEFVTLPNKTDVWLMYVDGESVRTANKPYIENGVIYLPYADVCEKLHCDEVVDAEYVDADTLIKHHKVSLTWEEEANAIYITSTLHYDGYRCFDDVIADPRKSFEILGRYCYIDAVVQEITETDVIVKKSVEDLISLNLRKSNFRSAEGTSKVPLNVGGKYRFCFELLSVDKTEFNGRLMETANIPSISTKYGFMQYRVKDWKKIEKWMQDQEINETEINADIKEVVDENQKKIIDMLIKYITSIDSSKKLKAYLLDCIPEERAIINVFVAAYSEGIIEEIRKAKDTVILKKRFVKKMMDNYGFNEQIVTWTFDTWNYYCKSEDEIC